MLTFKIILGYQGLLFRDLLWFFFLIFQFQFFFFNPTVQPNIYQETHSTLNEKKGGDDINGEKKRMALKNREAKLHYLAFQSN